MKLLGVLGEDVSHSLSPLLHNAAATVLGLDCTYLPFSVPDEAAFLEAVDALRVLGAQGANITIPFKRAAFARASIRTATATDIGAVNTFTFLPDGTVAGANTDGPGLVKVFERLARPLHKVQIFGRGGAAAAAAWAVREVGAVPYLCARTPPDGLARKFGGVACALAPLPNIDVVVSAIPGSPELAQQALAEWIDTAAAPIICDLAYLPDGESDLARSARRAGLPALDGRHLLVEQAALSLAGWTHTSAVEIRSAMAKAVELDDLRPL